MIKTIRNIGLVAGFAALLAACGGGSGQVASTPVTTPTPTGSATFQEKVSPTFATTFNASANSEPRDPAAGDVPALSLTAEPVDN